MHIIQELNLENCTRKIFKLLFAPETLNKMKNLGKFFTKFETAYKLYRKKKKYIFLFQYSE